jgi:hypothetical protein
MFMRRSFPWSLGLGVVGAALWGLAVERADFVAMGPLGLISILHWPYYAGLALVIVGFASELFRTPLRPKQLVALIVVLVVFIFGTACAVEPVAGLATTWIHAGMTQYILDHGQVLNNYAAEFSWPGGFSLAALLVSFAGQESAVTLLRWFPLVIELSYLAPLLVIARFSGVGRRAGYLGVALFYATNWIDQDYFSPQALNYLFLVVVATVLACWRPQLSPAMPPSDTGLRRRIRESVAVVTLRRAGGHDAIGVWRSGTTLAILAILALVCLGSAISHQLTPYALLLALAACLVGRRLGRPELLVLMALLAVGWLSLGASNYWIGHLSGHLRRDRPAWQHVRVERDEPSHRKLVTSACRGLKDPLDGCTLRARRHRCTPSRSGFARPGAADGAPFLLLAAQSYGGEGLLRVVLFGLPLVSLLAASAILPNRVGPIRPFLPRLRLIRHGRALIGAAVVVVLLAAALATSVVRGGNNAYEAFSTGELAAVNYAYDHVRPGQTIAMVAPFLPIGQRDLNSIELFYVEGNTIAANGSGLVKRHAAWIVLSQSQEAWGELLAGLPKGWESGVQTYLTKHGYRVVMRWDTATVLHKGPIL